MPAPAPTLPTARPAPRSLVVLRPIGYVEVGALLLGIALLVLNALKLAVGSAPGRPVVGELLGLGLLLWAGRAMVRGNRPLLLTIGRDALLLAPLGPKPSPPAETIPLGSITAYTYWLRVLKFRAFAQYHLRLELAGGRVLHLADRPGTRPDDPVGTVRLNVLAKRLARRTKMGLHRRPLFFLTHAARVLLWVSWAALAAALGLFWLGHPAGLLLLYPAVGYWASYYLGKGAAEITA